MSTALFGSAFAGNSSDDLDPATVYSGADFSSHSEYYYLGSVVPILRDSASTQVFLRAYSSYNHYDYHNDNTRIDADVYQGDAMLGYQKDFTKFTAAAFVGVDFQQHNLFPDDLTSRDRGYETGVKVAAEVEASPESTFYYNLDGDYSTAFSSYWARGRLGYSTKYVTFGPEGSFDGNVGYDAQRAGGFATFELNPADKTSQQLTFSGGYQFVSESGSNADGNGNPGGGGAGAYGAFVVGVSF